MATFTASRKLELRVTETLAAGASLPEAKDVQALAINSTQAFTAGAGGAETINLISYNKMTITPGSPSTAVTHDLDVMADLVGTAIDFAAVRGIYCQFVSGAAGTSCIIGNSGADAFEDAFMNGTTPAVVLPRGGIFAIDFPLESAGWTVTTNEDDLKFDCGTFATTNAVLTATYVGNSAA